MANPIVIVNVSQQQAPLPADLQRKGALISHGGTVLPVGTAGLLTQYADLEPLLANTINIATGAWASGVATINTAAPHGAAANTFFTTKIENCVPAEYNGTHTCVAIDADSFMFDLPEPSSGPIGAITTPGTITSAASSELDSMARTFFTQPALQAVAVLELGAGTVAQQIEVLRDFIDQNADQQVYYSYLVPRSWDGDADFLTELLPDFEGLDAKTYFFVTTTPAKWPLYTDLMKAAFVLVEAPPYQPVAQQDISTGTFAAGIATLTFATDHGVEIGQSFTLVGNVPAAYNGMFRAVPGTTDSTLKFAPASDPGGPITTPGRLSANAYSSPGVAADEFSLAAVFHRTLSTSPSTTSRVPPLCFAYTFGVTRFPTQGNSPLLTEIKAANVNYIGFGGEGGISNNMVVWGRFMDGRPWNYWYAVDWAQIEARIRVANVVINGSNTTINPLYYNQDGINRLQQALYQMGNDGVAFGLCLGDVRQVGLPAEEFANNLNKGVYAGLVVINAEPFTDYLSVHRDDYRLGRYGGLSFVFTPQRGFEQIIVNINVTDIVTP